MNFPLFTDNTKTTDLLRIFDDLRLANDSSFLTFLKHSILIISFDYEFNEILTISILSYLCQGERFVYARAALSNRGADKKGQGQLNHKSFCKEKCEENVKTLINLQAIF